MIEIIKQLLKAVVDLIKSRKKLENLKERSAELTKYEKLRQMYAQNGWEWQRMNLIGVEDTRNPGKDLFNDWIFCAMDGKVHAFKATVAPGVYFVKGGSKKMFDQPGAAHYRKGFHKRLYGIGKHRGYKAFVQISQADAWRDVNENFKDDDNADTHGFHGMNLHHAADAIKIGKYGAGCQVVRRKKDLKKLLKMAKESGQAYFNYGLFDRADMPFEV